MSDVFSPATRDEGFSSLIFLISHGWKRRNHLTWVGDLEVQLHLCRLCLTFSIAPYLYFLLCLVPPILEPSCFSADFTSADENTMVLCSWLCWINYHGSILFSISPKLADASFYCFQYIFIAFYHFIGFWGGVVNKNSLPGLFLKLKDRLWLWSCLNQKENMSLTSLWSWRSRQRSRAQMERGIPKREGIHCLCFSGWLRFKVSCLLFPFWDFWDLSRVPEIAFEKRIGSDSR